MNSPKLDEFQSSLSSDYLKFLIERSCQSLYQKAKNKVEKEKVLKIFSEIMERFNLVLLTGVEPVYYEDISIENIFELLGAAASEKDSLRLEELEDTLFDEPVLISSVDELAPICEMVDHYVRRVSQELPRFSKDVAALLKSGRERVKQALMGGHSEDIVETSYQKALKIDPKVLQALMSEVQEALCWGPHEVDEKASLAQQEATDISYHQYQTYKQIMDMGDEGVSSIDEALLEFQGYLPRLQTLKNELDELFSKFSTEVESINQKKELLLSPLKRAEVYLRPEINPMDRELIDSLVSSVRDLNQASHNMSEMIYSIQAHLAQAIHSAKTMTLHLVTLKAAKKLNMDIQTTSSDQEEDDDHEIDQEYPYAEMPTRSMSVIWSQLNKMQKAALVHQCVFFCTNIGQSQYPTRSTICLALMKTISPDVTMQEISSIIDDISEHVGDCKFPSIPLRSELSGLSISDQAPLIIWNFMPTDSPSKPNCLPQPLSSTEVVCANVLYPVEFKVGYFTIKQAETIIEMCKSNYRNSPKNDA